MVIALLTDFGDYYGGVMKGLIRKISRAEIIDVAHSITPQNVLEGAFLLYNSYKFFPEGSVFVSVVDPGVGGRRKALAIETENYWFVCPDNGIAYPSATDDGIVKVYEIREEVSRFSGYLSSTFHGRDLFAPAAALIKEGRLSEDYFLPCSDEIEKLELFDAEVKGNEIFGKVVYIDRFGNAVTNIREEVVSNMSPEKFFLGVLEIPFVRKYEDVDVGEPLCLIGSFNTLELSVRNGNFSRKFNLGHGNLRLRWE